MVTKLLNKHMRPRMDTGAFEARASHDRYSGHPLQGPAEKQVVSLDWRVLWIANLDALVGFLHANLLLRPDSHVVVWDDPGLRGGAVGRFLSGQLRVPAVWIERRLDGSLEPPRSFLHIGDGRQGVTLAEWCNRHARYIILPLPEYDDFDWAAARAFRPDGLFDAMDKEDYGQFVTHLVEDISGLCWRRIIIAVNYTKNRLTL
jgi:hypothetical protein